MSVLKFRFTRGRLEIDGISALASSLGNPLIMNNMTANMCHNEQWEKVRDKDKDSSENEEEEDDIMEELNELEGSLQGKVKFFCTIVYASNSKDERKMLWKEIHMHKRISGNHPWALFGDMNVTLNVEEHSCGGSHITEEMQEFRDCINAIELDDIGSSEFYFTWTKSLKNPEAKVLKKLDRVMIYEVEMIRVKLQEAKTLGEKNPHDCSIKEKVLQALCDYNEAVTDEEKLLAQKDRIKWLNEGDKKSSYFHKVIKGKRSKNRVDVICDDRSVLDDEGLFSTMLNQDEAEDMIRVVSNKEIKDAMFDIGDNRAPGPDGYSSLFFKRAWNIVGNDVCDAVKEFFDSGQMLGELNATLISLNFLELILKKFRFHTRMVGWIMQCVKTVGFTVCIHGERYGYFKGGKSRITVVSNIIMGARSYTCATFELFPNLSKSTLFFGSLKDEGKEKIKKLLRRLTVFLKGSFGVMVSAKGKAKIAWKNVCRPKEYKGLGIKNIKRWNEALLSKLLWNIASNKDTLWVKWIHMMKLKEGSIWNVQYNSNDSWQWKCLLDIRDKIADRLQDLYDARIPKMISISDMIDEGVWKWPLEWNSNEFEFINLRVPLITNGVTDKVKWRNDENKLVPFHMKFVYDAISPNTEKIRWTFLMINQNNCLATFREGLECRVEEVRKGIANGVCSLDSDAFAS
nr:RNA-directed DNA polymerase, eukaryota, reverse transcriptase zinc-binding domain protein [Tanacetum cinerariifolium]